MGHAANRTNSLMFAYFGTQGSLCQFTLNLARIAINQKYPSIFAISHSNELFADYSFLTGNLIALGPFSTFLNPLNALAAQAHLKNQLIKDNVASFISLMPHWSWPLTAPVIRQTETRHVVVVHDADPHLGDNSTLL